MASVAAIAGKMTTSHVSRNHCLASEEHKSRDEGVRLVKKEREDLTESWRILPRPIAQALPLSDRDDVETGMGIPIVTAASTHQLRLGFEERLRKHGSLSTPLTSVAGSEIGYDPLNPHSLLYDSNTDRLRRSRYPSSTRRQWIPSPTSLLHPVIPSRLRRIYNPANQATETAKISSLIAQPVKEMMKGPTEIQRSEMNGRRESCRRTTSRGT